jgi:RimJ/RimL family protein N-acetyltransferase
MRVAEIAAKAVRLRDGAAVVVRTAVDDDAPALAALGKQVAAESPFAVTEPDEIDPSEAKRREMIADHRRQASKLMLVCEAEGVAVGGISFAAHTKRRIAHVGNFGIAVTEGWRGRGVGRVLIQTLLEWAAEHPVIEKVGLGVVASNEGAIALYRSLGFVEEGRLVRQFKMGPGRYVDDLRMYRFVK